MDTFESYNIARAAGIPNPEAFLSTPLIGQHFDDEAVNVFPEDGTIKDALCHALYSAIGLGIVSGLAYFTIGVL